MSFLPIAARLIDIDAETAVLEIDAQTLRIPRSAIAGNPQKGDTVQLVGVAPGRQQDTDQDVARAMLNQLLGEGATNA